MLTLAFSKFNTKGAFSFIRSCLNINDHWTTLEFTAAAFHWTERLGSEKGVDLVLVALVALNLMVLEGRVLVHCVVHHFDWGFFRSNT